MKTYIYGILLCLPFSFSPRLVAVPACTVRTVSLASATIGACITITLDHKLAKAKRQALFHPTHKNREKVRQLKKAFHALLGLTTVAGTIGCSAALWSWLTSPHTPPPASLTMPPATTPSASVTMPPVGDQTYTTAPDPLPSTPAAVNEIPNNNAAPRNQTPPIVLHAPPLPAYAMPISGTPVIPNTFPYMPPAYDSPPIYAPRPVYGIPVMHKPTAPLISE